MAPAMRVFEVAVLDALHGLEEFLKMRAYGVRFGDLYHLGAARNLPDRRHDYGRSAGGDLGERLDLLVGHRTALDLPTEVGGDLLEGHVGDGGQHGMAVGRHVCSVGLYAEEVRCGELLNIFVGLRVEVELDGPAVVLRLLVGEERSRVVAADLHITHSVGRGAVPIIEDHGADGLEAALVVGADGHDHNHEGVFLRGGDADLGAGSDQERTQVERTAGAVRRNILFIGGDDLVEGLDEHLLWNWRHHAAHGGAVHTLRILVGTEDHDLAVLLAEGLHSLEALLSVVKAGGADVHCYVGVLQELRFAPLAVLPRVADVAVDVREAEAQVRPIYIISWHCLFPIKIKCSAAPRQRWCSRLGSPVCHARAWCAFRARGPSRGG